MWNRYDMPAGDTAATAQAIAQAILDGFDKHYRLFREASQQGKRRFETGAWLAQQHSVKERIQFYDQRVAEAVERLRSEFRAESVDDLTWRYTKLHYIGLLTEHKQPELAETFFNSVFCRIMHRTYFNNDFIFFRPTISTDYIESDPPTYRSYYPLRDGMKPTLRQVLLDFGWDCPFADLDRDIGYLLEAVKRHFGEWPRPEPNFQIQVLASAFYRNKGAYVIGRAVNGSQEYPFAVPVLHDANGRLYIDTILLDVRMLLTLFSLNRAYFMVDMEVPSGFVDFLAAIMPGKRRHEIYTMLGLQKQGKNMFYRDLMHHLRHSQDEFVVAPGIRGLVMLVFTLPSYPYVFKVIKDEIAPPKEVDRATVKSKYLLVKQVDRVGRMADTLEFSDVAFPKARFHPELLAELRRLAPSVLEEEETSVVIKHLYIEVRMRPLNISAAERAAGRARRSLQRQAGEHDLVAVERIIELGAGHVGQAHEALRSGREPGDEPHVDRVDPPVHHRGNEEAAADHFDPDRLERAARHRHGLHAGNLRDAAPVRRPIHRRHADAGIGHARLQRFEGQQVGRELDGGEGVDLPVEHRPVAAEVLDAGVARGGDRHAVADGHRPDLVDAYRHVLRRHVGPAAGVVIGPGVASLRRPRRDDRPGRWLRRGGDAARQQGPGTEPGQRAEHLPPPPAAALRGFAGRARLHAFTVLGHARLLG